MDCMSSTKPLYDAVLPHAAITSLRALPLSLKSQNSESQLASQSFQRFDYASRIAYSLKPSLKEWYIYHRPQCHESTKIGRWAKPIAIQMTQGWWFLTWGPMWSKWSSWLGIKRVLFSSSQRRPVSFFKCRVPWCLSEAAAAAAAGGRIYRSNLIAVPIYMCE